MVFTVVTLIDIFKGIAEINNDFINDWLIGDKNFKLCNVEIGEESMCVCGGGMLNGYKKATDFESDKINHLTKEIAYYKWFLTIDMFLTYVNYKSSCKKNQLFCKKYKQLIKTNENVLTTF